MDSQHPSQELSPARKAAERADILCFLKRVGLAAGLSEADRLALRRGAPGHKPSSRLGALVALHRALYPTNPAAIKEMELRERYIAAHPEELEADGLELKLRDLARRSDPTAAPKSPAEALARMAYGDQGDPEAAG